MVTNQVSMFKIASKLQESSCLLKKFSALGIYIYIYPQFFLEGRKLEREASAEQFSWNYLSSLCKKLNPREYMHAHGFVFTYVCTNLPKLCNCIKLCW